jgi:hypothetical protein
MSVLFMSDILIKVDTGMVVLEAWLLSDFLLAHNGYGFVQDGHSYSVAGLAGHRLGGFSLMSVRPNY